MIKSEEELHEQLRDYALTERTIGGLKTQIVYPQAGARSCRVLGVLMHGYGAPRNDLTGLAGPLLLECFRRDIKPALAFPGAPIELDFGGAAWWPLNMARLMEAAQRNSFDEMRNEVPNGIDDSRKLVVACVEQLLVEFNLSTSELLLGGFSQGAMISMDVATRGLAQPPAALGLLSGACICESQWRQGAGDRLSNTQVFQSHGRQDQVLPLQTGQFLNAVVTDLCREVEFYQFNGGHQIPDAAIVGLAELLGHASR